MAANKRKKRASKRAAEKKVRTVSTPKQIAAAKKRFISQLKSGVTPGVAAENVGVLRNSAYRWRIDDVEFKTKWENAVETYLDRLEMRVFAQAMKGNTSHAQFILKHRRRDVYGGSGDDKPKVDVLTPIPLQERYKLFERLGLPKPVIEGDYEEVEGDYEEVEVASTNDSSDNERGSG